MFHLFTYLGGDEMNEHCIVIGGITIFLLGLCIGIMTVVFNESED